MSGAARTRRADGDDRARDARAGTVRGGTAGAQTAGADRPEPAAVLDLQATVGNRAVRDLLNAAGVEPGRALPPSVRNPMEASFGRSFAAVAIHRGPAVDAAAEAMGAVAFATGEHVHLHSRVPGPDTATGRTVLAEELAHVAQGIGAAGTPDRLLHPGGSAEHEAHTAARSAAAGGPATVTHRPDLAGHAGRMFANTQMMGTDIDFPDMSSPPTPAGPSPTAAPMSDDVAAVRDIAGPALDLAIGRLGEEASAATNLDVAGDLEEATERLSGEAPTGREDLRARVVRQVAGAAITLRGSAEPVITLKNLTDTLTARTAELAELVGAAAEPGVDEEGRPAEPVALLPWEALILRAPLTWMGEAVRLLAGEEPDERLIALWCRQAGAVIRSGRAAPAVRPRLAAIALDCDLCADAALATSMSASEGAKTARSQLRRAATILEFSAHPPALWPMGPLFGAAPVHPMASQPMPASQPASTQTVPSQPKVVLLAP